MAGFSRLQVLVCKDGVFLVVQNLRLGVDELPYS